ncbi:MAG: peptide deformylase [Flavobacteriales bacterium]|nr:MAG: peptide deformylase [Flavobacteriales bacterium]PIE49175.1 MAG: peptide deformylase [Flavobacteriales bacterium]
MILPIVAYGHPVLRKVCKEIDSDYPHLKQLIADMHETMDNASGVGLAAPQIGRDIRLFIVNTEPFSESEDLDKKEKEVLKNFKRVFINAKILEENDEQWTFTEGCLSIPGINEDVSRNKKLTITYYDENFKKHTEELSGLPARVVQHEYDHIEGKLFTDKLSSLRKRLLKRKLEKITKGKVDTDYRMLFYKK